MRKSLLALGVAAATVVAPALAHASCHGRKVAGTVIGAVGGGLIGGAIAHRAPGALLGAGLGALAGHEIAGAGCHNEYRRAYYYRHHHYYRSRYYTGSPTYDRYAYGYERAGYRRCETREQAFYDERGQLIYRPTEVCR